MISHLPTALRNKLQQRIESGTFRTLFPQRSGIDFFSNDYLGLRKNKTFQATLQELLIDHPSSLLGSAGSRLVTGHSENLARVEAKLAEFHQVEAALLFPSGYKANLALFSAILQRHDYLLIDEYIHRSVIDGLRLSHAIKYKFKHNDLDHLEGLLKKLSGTVYIAVESLYSMEGTMAPLIELIGLAKRYHARLIVDEAHAFGVFGFGCIQQMGIQQDVFACTMTYGKAMALQGAAILGTKELQSYLINFSSPVIYSTGMPDYQVLSVLQGYQFIKSKPDLSNQLLQNIQYYRINMPNNGAHDKSPIQPFFSIHASLIPKLLAELEENNLSCFAVRSPTVPAGKERLRISIHADHKKQEIDQLKQVLNKYNE